jgi:hypothetical protein
MKSLISEYKFMGCAIKMNASKREVRMDQPSQGVPSHSNTLPDFGSRRNSQRRASSMMVNENEFWGVIPFYVLNNRVRLLCFEVSNKEACERIGLYFDDILDFLISESEKTNLNGLVVNAKQFKWIFKYGNSEKVIQAIGLQKQKNNITVMEGLTRENLKKKQKELKYAFSVLNDANFTRSTQ